MTENTDIGVVFLEIDEQGFDYQYVNEIVKYLIRAGQSTVLVLFNSASGSAAVQKIYGYKNIISTQEKLSLKYLESFSKSMAERTVYDSLRFFSFAENNDRRYGLMKNEVSLSSLSEHEMIFQASAKIPLYSVLNVKLPVDCYLTVIASEMIGERYKYTTVIHGVSSSARERLRRVVNQFVFTPPKVLDKQTVDSILKGEGKQNVIHSEQGDQHKDKKQNAMQESTLDYSSFKRKSKAYFSKL